MGFVAPQHVGSSWARAQTRVPYTGKRILNHCASVFSHIAFSFKTSLMLFFVIQHIYCQKWMICWRFSTNQSIYSLNAELEILCTKYGFQEISLQRLMCLKVNEVRCVLEEHNIKHLKNIDLRDLLQALLSKMQCLVSVRLIYPQKKSLLVLWLSCFWSYCNTQSLLNTICPGSSETITWPGVIMLFK